MFSKYTFSNSLIIHEVIGHWGPHFVHVLNWMPGIALILTCVLGFLNTRVEISFA
jgi:hypothetical protein